MFIDTSVVVAIFQGEPEARGFEMLIEQAAVRCTSALVRLECCMVLSGRQDRSPVCIQADFDAMVRAADIAILPMTDLTGRLAVEAFERYGKGRGSGAQLNLADCMSYACAREHGVPILFKGRDFGHTDLTAAS